MTYLSDDIRQHAVRLGLIAQPHEDVPEEFRERLVELAMRRDRLRYWQDEYRRVQLELNEIEGLCDALESELRAASVKRKDRA